jgi:hypothetical protein
MSERHSKVGGFDRVGPQTPGVAHVIHCLSGLGMPSDERGNCPQVSLYVSLVVLLRTPQEGSGSYGREAVA